MINIKTSKKSLLHRTSPSLRQGCYIELQMFDL